MSGLPQCCRIVRPKIGPVSELVVASGVAATAEVELDCCDEEAKHHPGCEFVGTGRTGAAAVRRGGAGGRGTHVCVLCSRPAENVDECCTIGATLSTVSTTAVL